MIDVDLVVAVITISVNAWLGAIVLRQQRPHKASTRLFLGMIAFILLWTFANYAVDKTSSPAGALWWMRALYSFALGFIYLFFLFAEQFGEMRSLLLSSLKNLVHVLAAAAVTATLGTSLVFASATVGPQGLADLSFGSLYLPINFCALALVLWSTAGLVQKARAAASVLVREQIVLIIAGWITFLGLVIIFGAILPYFIPSFVVLSKITPLFSILMVAATAYSIIRHQFLDVKLIAQRGLIFSILLGCILGIYVGTILGLTYLFSVTQSTAALLGGALTTIIGIFSAPEIEKFFKRCTDPIFFKDTYEYSAAIETLGTVLNTSLRLPRMAARSCETLAKLLKPEFVIFFYEKPSQAYGSAGPMEAAAAEEALARTPHAKLPILAGKRVIGTFVLGPRRSGDPYSSQDQALLRTFGIQAAVAFQKAEFYERLKRHSLLLEKKVQSRTKHLEELRQAQRQFMDDISHALQTPLTVLKSTIEVFPTAPLDTQAHYMRTITRSIDDLSRLIRNLLELAAIDAMPTGAQFEEVDLSALVAGVREYVETICREHDIALTSRIAPGIKVAGDAHQIEEAVTNVLSNAVRYTKDCPKRAIALGLRRSEGSVLLSISDTGIGINKEELPHIFDRFYRAQKEQGAGLGLAITYRIMERHHGSISAESVLGAGTTVILQFPEAEAGS